MQGQGHPWGRGPRPHTGRRSPTPSPSGEPAAQRGSPTGAVRRPTADPNARAGVGRRDTPTRGRGGGGHLLKAWPTGQSARPGACEHRSGHKDDLLQDLSGQWTGHQRHQGVLRDGPWKPTTDAEIPRQKCLLGDEHHVEVQHIPRGQQRGEDQRGQQTRPAQQRMTLPGRGHSPRVASGRPDEYR